MLITFFYYKNISGYNLLSFLVHTWSIYFVLICHCFCSGEAYFGTFYHFEIIFYSCFEDYSSPITDHRSKVLINVKHVATDGLLLQPLSDSVENIIKALA